MPAGRPSKYDPAFCDRVIAHMSEGASLASFAAEIEVARSSINEWVAQHAEFSEAVNIAKAKCASWWEKAGRNLVSEGGSSAQATMIALGLKNMAADDWREKAEVDHTHKMSPETAQWLGQTS